MADKPVLYLHRTEKIVYLHNCESVAISENQTIPNSYEEFVDIYAERIRKQVSGFIGINHDEIDDIVQDIIMQFIAGDYLSVYDPQRQAQYAQARFDKQMEAYNSGELQFKPARIRGKFTSFLFEFVYRRLLGIRDRHNRKYKFEGQSVEAFFDESEDDIPHSILAVVGARDTQFYSIELRELLQKVYTQLQNVTAATNTRNIAELFAVMVNEQFTSDRGFDRELYAAKKGITVSAVSMQIRDMREYLKGFGFDIQLVSAIHNRAVDLSVDT